MNFHADYNVVNGDVLEAMDSTWGELPDVAPDGDLMSFSERAVWFRISGQSAPAISNGGLPSISRGPHR